MGDNAAQADKTGLNKIMLEYLAKKGHANPEKKLESTLSAYNAELAQSNEIEALKAKIEEIRVQLKTMETLLDEVLDKDDRQYTLKKASDVKALLDTLIDEA